MIDPRYRVNLKGTVKPMTTETPTARPRHPLGRFFASLRRRGLGSTLASLQRHLATGVSRLADRRFDREHGLETAGFVETAAMDDVTSPNLARAIRYEPTRAIPLRRFFKRLAPPAEGTFVDIGCGKGRTLVLAAQYGFDRVVGVDFSASLCLAAERNLEAYRLSSGRRFEWSVVNGDAAGYGFGPTDRVVYMYNPFDETVMTTVMDNLAASLEERPRPLRLIYHNPVCHSVIVAQGRFRPVLRRRYGGCEFVAYTNE